MVNSGKSLNSIVIYETGKHPDFIEKGRNYFNVILRKRQNFKIILVRELFKWVEVIIRGKDTF